MSTQQAVAEPGTKASSESVRSVRRLRLEIARRTDVAVLVGVFVFGVAYEIHFLFRGWVPWDEGALAESASRILAGQLPHRDFTEIYTGGLGYLHALAFLLFGEELSSMRIVLAAFFAVWIPVLYWIARRFAPAAAAGACVIACLAWSVPNYSASMPSWYNLFFATFAVAALFRYLESRRGRWLAAAGLACGLSMLVKSTGIYVAIALSLVLLFDEQVRAEHDAVAQRRSYLGLVLAAAATSVAFLVVLLHRRLGAAEVVGFLVPGASISAFLVWNEARVPRAPAASRIRSFMRLISRFGFGLALPLVVFVSPYVVSNSLGSLLDGVLVEPSARLQFAALKPLTLSSLPITLSLLVAFYGFGYAAARGKRVERLAAAAMLAAWLVLTETALGYRVTWTAVRDASLLLVPLGILLMAARVRRGGRDVIENVRAFALLAVFAFGTLIQFPWSGPTYFYYVAPLAFLAALAIAGRVPRLDGAYSAAAVSAVFLFLAAFGLLRVNDLAKGGRESIGAGVPLGLARSGPLRVSPADARLYRRVVSRIREVATSRYIYSGPDAPELYFLADRLDPTGTAFDFFKRGPAHDRELLRTLIDHRVSVVALNLEPSFSPPLDSHLRAALGARYPHRERIGRFELRWRT